MSRGSTALAPFWAPVLAILLAGAPAAAENILKAEGKARDALEAMEIGKLTRAREHAQEVLEKDSDHFIATWVMCQVFFVHEANHPRALFLVRKGRKLLHDAYGKRPKDPDAQSWDRKLIKAEAHILGDMDLREEQLAMYVAYDKLYKPPIEVHRIWPLVKLGRYDEARKIGKKLIYSDDPDTRIRAYNGLLALADEARQRREGYRWGSEGLEKTQNRSCVLASNMARSALQNMLFDKAEEYVAMARKAEWDDCSGSPLSHLVWIHLLQGEFQKTISTLKQLREEPLSQRMRVQFEMGNKSRMVELLYALGQFEDAEKRVREVMTAPDRAGLTSASKENKQISDSMMFWTVLEARREQELERASVRPTWAAMTIRLRLSKLRVQQWEQSRIILRLGTLQDLLVTALRPYFLDIMPWFAPTFVRILGPGVVLKAVADARRLDSDFEKKMGGYFDAVEAEAHWRAGRVNAAESAGESAVKGLPKKAKLVRWRVQAILAHLAWKDGRKDEARKHFHEVLHKFPTTLRHLGIALPATVEHRGGSDAKAIAKMLNGSRRLQSNEDSGFTVSVEQDDDAIRLCLRGERGFQFACVGTRELEAERKRSDEKLEGEARLLALVDLFHDKAFAPMVELTQSDINTLDGRTGRIGANDALKDILGEDAP